MKYYFVFAIYYNNVNQFAVCFSVDSKMNSSQKECTNPEDRRFTDRPNMSNNRTLHLASRLKLKPWKFKVDGPINGKGGGGGSL